MKRTISLALALFCFALAGHAAPYFPGAWWSTKDPIKKFAGAVEVAFYTDNTMDFDIYFGAGYDQTVHVSYLETLRFYTFTLVDAEGWVWVGKFNKATGQLTGTFHSADQKTSGKFQCALSDDGA